LSATAALVLAVDWLRFEEPRSGGGRPFVLAVLAIAPVLLRPLWLRVGGVAVSALLAASVAFSVSPLALWPGGDRFFGPLASRFGRGFLDFYDFRLPIDPARHERMHQAILAAIFGFTLAVALAVAARRVIPAVLFFLVGAGWPATLLAGGNELGRGIVMLAVALALLAGLTERPSRLALGAAGVVLVGALALSSSSAVASTESSQRAVHLGRALRRGSLPEEEDDRADDPRAAPAVLLACDGARPVRRDALAGARLARDAEREP
jgi:hypothetical protein